MNRIHKSRSQKLLRHSKRITVAMSGGLIVIIGLILVPLPGPGWLVVFSGLAVLATEFQFAVKLLEYTKEKYDKWVNWLKKKNNKNNN